MTSAPILAVYDYLLKQGTVTSWVEFMELVEAASDYGLIEPVEEPEVEPIDEPHGHYFRHHEQQKTHKRG